MHLQRHYSQEDLLNIKKLKTLPNLSKLYETGDIETKRSILCSIFSEKLEFQEIAFRTPKLNSVAALILLINNKLKNKKEE